MSTNPKTIFFTVDPPLFFKLLSTITHRANYSEDVLLAQGGHEDWQFGVREKDFGFCARQGQYYCVFG